MTATAETKTTKRTKKATAVTPEAITPIVDIAPVFEAATVAPKAEKLDFVGGIAEIHNRDGFVVTMNAGRGASSECRHRELDTLLPHVAVPVGTAPETVAEMLAARAEKFLARPKIQRLIASREAAKKA